MRQHGDERPDNQDDEDREDEGAGEDFVEAGAEMDEDEAEASQVRLSAAFFGEVMQGLSQTNFARGWTDRTMYDDFLAWCETSPEADAIIQRFYPQIPSLLVDPEGHMRLISLQADVATELMKALLEEFEQQRIDEFLQR